MWKCRDSKKYVKEDRIEDFYDLMGKWWFTQYENMIVIPIKFINIYIVLIYNYLTIISNLLKLLLIINNLWHERNISFLL